MEKHHTTPCCKGPGGVRACAACMLSPGFSAAILNGFLFQPVFSIATSLDSLLFHDDDTSGLFPWLVIAVVHKAVLEPVPLLPCTQQKSCKVAPSEEHQDATSRQAIKDDDIYSSLLGHFLAAHDLLKVLWIGLMPVPCWCVDSLMAEWMLVLTLEAHFL